MNLRAVWWIGWYSFLDSWRNRLVLGVLLLLLPILLGAAFLQAQQIDLQTLILRDLGLLILWGFGLLVLTVVIFDQIFPDLERRSAFFVLSRIPSRSGYLVGRFLGIVMTLAALHLLLGGGLFLALRAMFGTWFPEFLIGAFLILLAQSVFAALLLCLSTCTSRLVTLSLGTLFFVGGHFTDQLRLWTVPFANPLFTVLAEFLSAIVPNFNLFAPRLTAVFGIPFEPANLGLLTAYATALSLFYLGLGSRFLAHRDL